MPDNIIPILPEPPPPPPPGSQVLRKAGKRLRRLGHYVRDGCATICCGRVQLYFKADPCPLNPGDCDPGPTVYINTRVLCAGTNSPLVNGSVVIPQGGMRCHTVIGAPLYVQPADCGAKDGQGNAYPCIPAGSVVIDAPGAVFCMTGCSDGGCPSGDTGKWRQATRCDGLTSIVWVDACVLCATFRVTIAKKSACYQIGSGAPVVTPPQGSVKITAAQFANATKFQTCCECGDGSECVSFTAGCGFSGCAVTCCYGPDATLTLSSSHTVTHSVSPTGFVRHNEYHVDSPVVVSATNPSQAFIYRGVAYDTNNPTPVTTFFNGTFTFNSGLAAQTIGGGLGCLPAIPVSCQTINQSCTGTVLAANCNYTDPSSGNHVVCTSSQVIVLNRGTVPSPCTGGCSGTLARGVDPSGVLP